MDATTFTPKTPQDLGVQRDYNHVLQHLSDSARRAVEEAIRQLMKLRDRQAKGDETPQLQEAIDKAEQILPELGHLDPASDEWMDKLNELELALFDEKLNMSEFDKYAADIQSDVPAERTLGVARSAVREGKTEEEITIILESDPEVIRLAEEQGIDTAERYAELATQAAIRKEAAASVIAQDSSVNQQQGEDFVDPSFALDREIDLDIEIEIEPGE